MLKKTVEKKTYELAMAGRDLEQEVSRTYYKLIWLKQRRSLVGDIYQLYAEADKIANLKFETGESNYLSKVVMDTRKQSLKIQLDEAGLALKNGQRDLMKLMKSDEWPMPAEDTLARYPLPVAADSAMSDMNQLLDVQYLMQNVSLAGQSLKVARSRISPGLTVGYFRQTIEEAPGFDGWEFTLKIPLWFRPQSAGIQQAKIQYIMTQNTQEQKSFEIQKNLESYFHEKEVLDNKLKTYEEQVLKNAGIIIENANTMYKNGEIEYLDYIRNISEAINIRIDYLDNLDQYNQTVIKISYLLKK